MSKKRMLMDGVRGENYVGAWKEGRQEIAVQVWSKKNPEGAPDGDWLTPAMLGIEACIAQAVLQTEEE